MDRRSEGSKQITARGSPDLITIAWIAGFFEGEGSVSSFNYKVEVSQKDTEPLKILLHYLGGRIVATSTAHIYKWYATGTRARGIAMTLYPLLTKRRQQQIKAFMQQ